MTIYIVGSIGFMTVGAAFAKGPVEKPALLAAAPTPAGCIDSPRGRTHVLRFCGDQHYWIKTKAAPMAPWFSSGFAAGLGGLGGPGTVGTVSINLNR
jgi:hypothetical protein